MNAQVSLSVILPNYNQARTIGATLDALLAQSARPEEILVVDDGSTDDSVAVVQSFVQRAPVVKLLRQERNQGAWSAMQRALAVARGEYLYLHAADDLVLPGFFEKSIALLQKHPQAGLCCSWPTYFMDGSGPDHVLNPTFWSDVPRYFSPDELAETIRGDYIPCHASIVRHEAWKSFSRVPSELAWHADWFMVLAIAFRRGLCYLPEALASIRTSENTYSSAGRKRWPDQKRVLTSLLALLKSEDYRDLLPYFVRGSVLSHFGLEIVQAVMETPELWDSTTLMLVQQPLTRWTERINQTVAQRELRQACYGLDLPVGLKVAEQNLQLGKFDLAAGLLVDLQRRFPRAAAVQRAAARLERARGDGQAALRHAKSAFDLAPDEAANQSGLVLALTDVGQWELAERLCDRLVTTEEAARTIQAGIADVGAGARLLQTLASRFARKLAEPLHE